MSAMMAGAFAGDTCAIQEMDSRRTCPKTLSASS